MYRLALALGRTVAELRYGSAAFLPLSGRELSAWAAYEQVHGPLDIAARNDLSSSIVAATVAATVPRKTREKIDHTKFLPVFDRDAAHAEQTVEEQIEVMSGYVPRS